MTTVREAAFDLLRTRGMTTIFGNPGSTELPMLAAGQETKTGSGRGQNRFQSNGPVMDSP